MAIHKYLRAALRNQDTDLWKQRRIEWRKEPTTVRVARPLRLDRARAVGYKAKQGYIVVRQRVSRGGRQRPKIRKGRRSKAMRRRKVLRLSYKAVAERRAAEKFQNMTVLNSYELTKDGVNAWYEVILVDPQHPNITQNKPLSNMANKKGRTHRGLTSEGTKNRGQRKKGKGTEKTRPSLNARKGRGN